MSLNDLHNLLASVSIPPHIQQSLTQAIQTEPPQMGGNSGPLYSDPRNGVAASIGGSIPLFGQQVGGTLGMQTNGQPFGSWNWNHQPQGQFGPQGN